MKYLLGIVVLLGIGIGGVFILAEAGTVTEVPTRFETAQLLEISQVVQINGSVVKEEGLLATNDVITTNELGRAIVRSGTQLLSSIGEQSEVTFVGSEDLRETSIDVASGRVWSRLERSLEQDEVYEVYTPTMVAAVRGTAFDTEVSEDLERIMVAEGEVLVAKRDGSGEEVLVRAGTQVTVTDGELVVTIIDPAQYSAWWLEHTADDWEWGGADQLEIRTAHRDGAFFTHPGQITIEGQGFNQIHRIEVDGEALPFVPVSDRVIRVPATAALSVTESSVGVIYYENGEINPLEVFVGSYDEVRKNLF